MDKATPIWKSMTAVWQRRTTVIARVRGGRHLWCISFCASAFTRVRAAYQIPLLATLVLGGLPLVYESVQKLLKAGIRFRSAGRNFHCYIRAPGRIPGRLHHRVDAGGR